MVTAHYHPVIQDEDIVITADVDGFVMSPRILDPLQKASSFWVWGYDYSRILGVEFQIPLLGKNHTVRLFQITCKIYHTQWTMELMTLYNV